jgi:hypothetical protein
MPLIACTLLLQTTLCWAKTFWGNNGAWLFHQSCCRRDYTSKSVMKFHISTETLAYFSTKPVIYSWTSSSLRNGSVSRQWTCKIRIVKTCLNALLLLDLHSTWVLNGVQGSLIWKADPVRNYYERAWSNIVSCLSWHLYLIPLTS